MILDAMLLLWIFVACDNLKLRYEHILKMFNSGFFSRKQSIDVFCFLFRFVNQGTRVACSDLRS